MTEQKLEAPDQDEQPTAELIEASLTAKGFRLRFPPVLEAMFERDTGSERRQMFVLYNTVSLIAYDLLLFTYFRNLPDVAVLTTLVQLLLVTPLSIVAIIYTSQARRTVLVESIPSFFAVISLIAGLAINNRSQIPVAMLYNYSPIITLLYVNVVVSVRFTVAAWTTVIVFLITAIDMAGMREVIPHAKDQIVSSVVIVGLMSLLANYKVDSALRRAYLLNARERLRRVELARFAERQALDYGARQRTAEVLEAGTRGFSGVAAAALDDLAQVSGEMRTLAEQLARASGTTAQRAASMAAGAHRASIHVEATATAIRDLAATAATVSRGVAGSIEMANRAIERAGQTTATITRLSGAAGQIGAVVTTIHDIAARTKLLALNAMIEAARAGPAGRGFSVVAEEVKVLALQAAQATETISEQIGAIQVCTAEAVNALQGIDATIGEISGVATEVSAVMRQQATATEEISRNIAGAVSSAQDVSGTAGEVQRDAEETGSVAARVLHAASAVGDREIGMRGHVADFLVNIRTA